MRICLASNNAGKVRELAQLLADLPVELITLRELGIVSPEETGLSFIENALLKARHAARHSGLPALADDSGLEVDALNGAPGIYSARYAGAEADDAQNNRKLLEALRGVPAARRGARFHCVLAYMRHPADPTPLICHGSWEGRILEAPVGDGGFGYDPIFHALDADRAAAQLSPEDKARHSHRGRALRALLQTLPERLR
ncbi:RdgB/HAM1 family non-canonical purine NTP pyrophosphatase [Alkalilimnicola sp. S0819]|uniref:RdgB/HAM1 family non-canonical purine NTP pyrophosphatase n=1 Tax=Alkalilimnicola sp. S0819 TaxID=2613922 RepID=UPI0012626DF6|nr:RdgB/HAM1 family non-canonical purine NTP pyrophosphatase [Alkalilimnicola sp. S0819]KAB7624420.1 RdgB/HAM1 family non-canonical purine NTP pyrophosphatase [Alkalilimnicola sp. S0819]MPQ16250.1 RdgB/HAM1 family non-canonical purine NTP pyrophosphatase [Alkalilimnicola sp. S0819]